MGLIDSILAPLEWIVSFVLRAFHSGLTALGLPANGGAAWTLSIVGLVVLIRIILIPLFVRQIKAQRGMQALQPRMKEIQQKYKDDRQRQSEEMMKLYKETGTNPFSSCLPILAQSPIFFALFRVLNEGIALGKPVGVLTQDLVNSARQARLFGAPLYAIFTKAAEYATQGINPTSVRVVTGVLIVLMTVTTFTTQRQLMAKNMPADAPMMQQQKLLLYVFPLMFGFFGINFPLGVLVYWFTTNLWTMGQQFYVIRNNPMPGTPAEKALLERRAHKAAQRAARRGEDPVATDEVLPAPVQRQQPKRTSKSNRKKR
ncbi:MAG TPA: membrane protein insertase YidC [Actinobacteria bacterium]|nr:membrane protein insertase YidC [Actinomycetota bacterium]